MESCRHRIQSDGGVIPASAKQGALRRATCATEHLKETKAFDHFWPSKVVPCRGERRKGLGKEAPEGASRIPAEASSAMPRTTYYLLVLSASISARDRPV
ncbi:hypothetical protein [Sphingobacterium griseoflavum]|uniref:hypothetical protein n=1 Tax=Sphingobacterium griseoflavum TaxID=1474952 RepID=UPI00167748B3|nr:hypothetical protein [Sphingobacterium griseoflavum]